MLHLSIKILPWDMIPALQFIVDVHLAKSYILKSFPKFTFCTTNTVSDVYLFSLVFTQFTYFPQDISETHTSLHSTEFQLILRYDNILDDPPPSQGILPQNILTHAGCGEETFSRTLLGYGTGRDIGASYINRIGAAIKISSKHISFGEH